MVPQRADPPLHSRRRVGKVAPHTLKGLRRLRPLQRSIAAILLLTAASVACGRHESPVGIGLAGPLGDARGRAMKNGAALAVAQVNRAGGVRGRMLELVLADDSADAEVAVRVARRLYETPQLVAVVGHLTTGATLAAAPTYNGGPDPLVQISPTASGPSLAGVGPYSFRVCPTDRAHAAGLADFALSELGTTRAAILYENDDYGRGVRDAFRVALAERGGETVADDPYLASLPTFEPYLRRAARAGSNVVLVAGEVADAMRIVATMDSLGLALPVIGADGLVGMTPPAGWEARFFVSTAYLANDPGTVNETFVRAYRAAYGDASPDHRAAAAYDAVRLLAAAIETGGADREAIRQYLVSLGRDRPPFPGATGQIAFDDDGNVRRQRVVIAGVHDHQLEAVFRP